jgi:viroplasmin and RNaseH domain-containing protein
MSRIYRDFVRNLEIEIQWNKVLGHSGDRWNERADALAKNGAINNIVECKSSSRDIELKNSVSIIEELEEAAEDFAVFLESNGYIAEYLHIENNMAAKICVEKEGQTVGYVNIYNTSKLHLQPRYHEIKQIEARKEIEELYNIFMLNYHLEL